THMFPGLFAWDENYCGCKILPKNIPPAVRCPGFARAARALGSAPRTTGNKDPRGISAESPSRPDFDSWLTQPELRREWAARRRRDETRPPAVHAGASP